MPVSLSHVVHLFLSKQSGVTARTNFSSRVLVLPAKERFSFKVFNYTIFSAECFILVKGKQNNMLHFYWLPKPLFPEMQGIAGLSIFNRQRITKLITCKFGVKLYPSLVISHCNF